MMVSSYFAKVGVDVNKADFARVDRHFDLLQKRLDRFQSTSSKIKLEVRPTINIASASKSLNRQIQAAAKDVNIHLKRFTFDTKSLANQISNSMATKGGSSRIRLNATLSQQSLMQMRQQVQTALSGMIISPRVRPVVTPGNTPRSPGNGKPGGSVPSSGSGASGGFNGLGWLGRGALGLLPAFGAAAAFSGINTATKTATQSDMASRGIFTEANMPDGSTRNVYAQSNEWIRKHAYNTGASLPDILPSYQSFMSSSMPTAGFEGSQEIFKAFSQFGTVRGADKESMKRALIAVSQISGKGTLQSEEFC